MNTINLDNYLKLLVFIENYAYWSEVHQSKAIYNKQHISEFLNIPYSTIRRYFNKAEQTNRFIIQEEKKRCVVKKDGEKTEWAMCVYVANRQQILDFINLITPYNPSKDKRKKDYKEYCDFSHRRSIPEHKLEKEIGKHNKKEKDNIEYQNDYKSFTELLDEVNSLLPESLKNIYLKEGKNRLYNPLCSTAKPTDINQERYEVIHQFLGIEYDNIASWDENASIFRTEYALHHDSLLSRSVDLYDAIWKMCDFGKELTSAYRKYFKRIIMPIYMTNGRSRAVTAIAVSCGCFITPKGERINVNSSLKEALLMLKEYIYPSKSVFEGVREILDKTTEALKKFLNTDRFQNERIFILESNTFVLMLHRLCSEGYKVINVYDCFYYDKSKLTEDDIIRVHDECLLEAVRLYKPK